MQFWLIERNHQSYKHTMVIQKLWIYKAANKIPPSPILTWYISISFIFVCLVLVDWIFWLGFSSSFRVRVKWTAFPRNIKKSSQSSTIIFYSLLLKENSCASVVSERRKERKRDGQHSSTTSFIYAQEREGGGERDVMDDVESVRREWWTNKPISWMFFSFITLYYVHRKTSGSFFFFFLVSVFGVKGKGHKWEKSQENQWITTCREIPKEKSSWPLAYI